MKDEFAIRFGARIRALRIAHNLSQERLAEMAEFHRTYVGMIERGEKNLTLRNIVKLASLFNITLSELFAYEVKDQKPGN